MTESTPYTYRLTEEGDLILGGAIPEYKSPELYPHYVHRDSVLRVVALPETRIAAHALAGYPNLRVAVLSDAVSIGEGAFADCPMLAAIQLSPTTVHIAPDAFRACPRLFCIDYAGTEAELSRLLGGEDGVFSAMLVRTLPEGGAEKAAGKIGEAEWRLDDAGVLTVFGGAVPDLPRYRAVPWQEYLGEIRHLVIGRGVGYIGERVFSAMPALSALSVIGNTEIADFAFTSCDRLTRIDLFSAVTRLGLCSLAGVGARELMLPPSLRRIPEGLLQSAFALRTLVLPLVPFTADGPFLEHCEALADIKFLADGLDRRALAASLYLSPRAPLSCFDPAAASTADLDKTFVAAERAIRTAAASYAALGEAIERPRAHAPRLSPLIDEAENAYLSLERIRFEPGGAADLTVEGMPYKKRVKILKEREKERKEACKEAEAKAEKSQKRMLEGFEALCAALKCAEEAAKKEQRDLAAATAEIEAAEAAIEGRYPLDAPFRARAVALREGIAGFTETLPPDIIPNVITALSEYKLLAGYHRFDELRNSLSRAMLLLSEGRTDSGEEAAATHRVPPCILVAGGDPAFDRSTSACMAALRRAGAVVEWADPNARRTNDCGYDALLLCDGAEPEAYGGFSHGLRMSDAAARRESALFSAFFLYGKPIMGIGRGAQQINLYLGGTMRWNLNTAEREVHAPKNGKAVAHTITVTPDNALSEIYDLDGMPMRVLSSHTSAIRTLGRELVSIAKTHDGVVEAFVHRRVPLIGVQFALDRMLTDAPSGFAYPAFTIDDGRKLFEGFVALACRVREKPPVAGTEDRYTRIKRS